MFKNTFLLQPCPFGLIKRLDPVVKKITSVGSSAFQKNLQRLDQPTLVNFFGNEKILISKKNTTMGFKWCFDPIVVIFFEIKIFSFPKKITSVGWSNRCKFFWNALDPTLVIFLTFFEKNYNDWIKCKLSKSQTKWTGLMTFFDDVSCHGILDFEHLYRVVCNVIRACMNFDHHLIYEGHFFSHLMNF